MYVAVKGGEQAIENSQKLLQEKRRGDTAVADLSLVQIKEQLGLAVDRVMAEGSLYNPDLAALAIKQAQGDLVEAIFLLRAYRTTLPRFGTTDPVNTGRMRIQRRISSTFKDLPGGQVLGPTYDYTHRLLDFTLAAESGEPKVEDADENNQPVEETPMPRVVELLNSEGLIETEVNPTEQGGVADLTREPMVLPADRDLRLQALARADEGFLLALGYSTQRGYGNTHPFAGEIRVGTVEVEFVPEELGFPVVIGEMELTECEMINQFQGSKEKPPQFTRGYGLAFGHSERKAMSMALVDRALRCKELGETPVSPAQDEEFILAHGDNVEASGFVQHLKLPHYVDFQ
ncbi:MAG: carbon-phosphorus lyase complex subunit PhnI, partial [Chromatiales bacterium]|nr:carbon-phosphorus lyase complex subunit PhnI [Chromatiales bacterium]